MNQGLKKWHIVLLRVVLCSLSPFGGTGAFNETFKHSLIQPDSQFILL